MGKIFSLLSTLFLLCACADQYNIAGNSSVPMLDGRMLYLRVSPDGMVPQVAESGYESICLDSCKVVHGRFTFEGDVDSAMMAMLYTGDQIVMPMVLENGNLSVQVDNVEQNVSGGPLNEKLYKFFQKKNRIENEMWELQQKIIAMMRSGETPEAIDKKVSKKAQELTKRAEDLETKFVMENYTNVLGPGFFMLLCSQYPTPIMTDQIRKIVKSAPTEFLANPYVSAYIEEANARVGLPFNPEEDFETISTSFTITFSEPDEPFSGPSQTERSPMRESFGPQGGFGGNSGGGPGGPGGSPGGPGGGGGRR